jgi:hypothetical protein
MEGNQLISRRSSLASGARAAGRLLACAAAAAVACGTVGLAGSTAAGAATVMTKSSPADRLQEPWLDSDFVITTGPPAANSPGMVFRVSANGGIPWIMDPNTGVWHNLRGIQGSESGVVTNISVANNAGEASKTPGVRASLVISARTESGKIYQTKCSWGNNPGMAPMPASTTVPFFPNSPDLTPPCGPNWRISS